MWNPRQPGQVDKRIEDLCTIFVELQKAFLDQEITVLQIQDDVGVISTQLGEMTIQLMWVSSHVSDLGTCPDYMRIIDQQPSHRP